MEKEFSQKNKRLIDCFLVTVFIFLFIGVFSKWPIGLGFLNPIGNSVKDFDIYDVVFSKFRDSQRADTNIVLINVGNLDRAGIAGIVNRVNSYDPKVIGLDLFFWENKDRPQDSILSDAVNKCPKLVLAGKLEKYDPEGNKYDSMITSDAIFGKNRVYGFANLPEEDNEGFRTIRRFRPNVKLKNSVEYSFPVRVVEVVDKKYLAVLNNRNNDKELINYRGNIDKYYYLDSSGLFKPSFNGDVLRNKIVLIGYMGIDPNTKTFEDIFFTPLNERYAGRTFPDMYGVVINANIVSMLINNTYIDVMPYWLSFAFAVILSFFSIYILLLIKLVYKDWFGAVFKMYIFLLTLLNIFIGVYVFNRYNYKINLTLTILAIVLGPTCLDLYQLFIRKKIFPKKKGKDERAVKINSVGNTDVLSGT